MNDKKVMGRRGIEDYRDEPPRHVAEDRVFTNPGAETVNSTYGDFCVAQIAAKASDTLDGAMFKSVRTSRKRPFRRRRLDSCVAKNSDGSWVTQLPNGCPDPCPMKQPNVEGCGGQQHHWDVPHEPEELFELWVAMRCASTAEFRSVRHCRRHFPMVEQRWRQIHGDVGRPACPPDNMRHTQPRSPTPHRRHCAGRRGLIAPAVRRRVENGGNCIRRMNLMPASDEDTRLLWRRGFLMSAAGFFNPTQPVKRNMCWGTLLFDKIDALMLREGQEAGNCAAWQFWKKVGGALGSTNTFGDKSRYTQAD